MRRRLILIGVLVAAAVILAIAFGIRPGRGGNRPGATVAPRVVKTRDGIEMVLLPGGWFSMGSSGGHSDERPVHKVHVAPFLMDRHEVTQQAYLRQIIGNPSHFKGPEHPVEQVRWHDAILYCNARSRAEGLEPSYDEKTGACNYRVNGYRLPSEAEWEYACRGGTNTDYSFGDSGRTLRRYAWYKDNAGNRTHAVGQKRPNPWGLFDMYGNVAEWCNDRYGKDYYARSPAEHPRGPADGEKYVVRGGAWNSRPDSCRSARRKGEAAGSYADACFRRPDIGFRCVRRATAAPASASAPAASPAAARPAGRATGFVYGDVYLTHDTGRGHPESVRRLMAIVERLEATGLTGRLMPIAPRDAEVRWLITVHDADYVRRVAKAVADGAAYIDSRDTPVGKNSYAAAVASAGGAMAAVDAVASGTVVNAFCAIRPPGHHALKDRAMGSCLFNNIAIAARYAQRAHGLKKVLIVDWDVHHGNGTQAIFDADPTVLYFSTHQSPFYPGTGRAGVVGSGAGKGLTVNVPLPAGAGDADVARAFRTKLVPAADAFKPDILFISAGFDAHADDPIGGMKMTPAGYAALTRIVKRIAARHAGGRLVSVLEGGYDPGGLARSVEAHIVALRSWPTTGPVASRPVAMGRPSRQWPRRPSPVY